MPDHESHTITRSPATILARMANLATVVSIAVLAVAACGGSDTAQPPASAPGGGIASITLAPSSTTAVAADPASPSTVAIAPSTNGAVPATAVGQAASTTTRPVEPSDEQLAAQLWPAALPLPEGFVLDQAQDYPDRGFVDFTLVYTGTGIAEESLFNWENANLEGVDPAAADGGQNLTYLGGHVEVHKMTDTLFRVILAK